jgi:hypothetical protein
MRRRYPFVRSLVVTLVVAGLTTAGSAGAGATAHRDARAAAPATRVTQRSIAVTGLERAGRDSACADVGYEIRYGGRFLGC